MTDLGCIYGSGHEDELLNTYCEEEEEEESATRKKTRQTARKEANFLTISLLKSYRSTLSTRRRGKLSAIHMRPMMNMPVDILLEVLEYLHPIDLMHLKGSNDAFANLLDGPTANSVWKTAFQNYLDEVELPSDVSLSTWTDLLFGPQICGKCGESPAPLNITFRQRFCNPCHEDEFTQRSSIDASGGKEGIHDLLKQSMVLVVDPFDADATHDITWSNFNKVEADEIGDKLAALRKDVDHQIDGAKAKLDTWLSERQTRMLELKSFVYPYQDWMAKVHRSYLVAVEDKLFNINSNLKSRLDLLNAYVAADIEESTFEPILKQLVGITGIRRLSRRRFARLRPALEEPIRVSTEIRLKAEREKLLQDRLNSAKEAYKKYMRTCPPSTWSYMPPMFVVKHFELFSEAINAPHGDPLKDEDLIEPVKQLPAYIDEWRASKLKQLASLLPSQERPEGDDETAQEPDVLALDFATSVFHCHGSVRTSLRTGGCLIGWDGAGPHLRCGALENWWDKRLHFSQRGYDAAGELVRLAGLDPSTAKIWDMDALDPRFVCLTCPTEANGAHGGSWRKVWCWREAVYHYMLLAQIESHTTPRWSILAPAAEADVKAREGPDPYFQDVQWGCNHCDAHFSFVVRKSAIEHAKEVHDIMRPVQNLDFVYHMGGRRTHPNPHLLPEDHPREYACIHCAPTKRRLFTATSIMSHLKDSHHLKEPVEGKDWKKFAVILRSTRDSVPAMLEAAFEEIISTFDG